MPPAVDAEAVLAKARADLLEAGVDEDEIGDAYDALGLLDQARQSLCRSWLLELNEAVGELVALRSKMPADVWVRIKRLKADLPERRKRDRLEDRLRRLWADRPALLRAAEVYRPGQEGDD